MPNAEDGRVLKVTLPTITISPKGEDRVRSGHPWVYRSDVIDVEAGPGDVVQVNNRRKARLGYALYSDRSEISLRFLARGAEAPTLDTWRTRLAAAVAFRESLNIDATAYRLVHGEADRLPGLVVDRYGSCLVLQALVQGVDRLLPELTQMLVDRLQPDGILARNDPRVRLLEGLEQSVTVLYGTVPDTIDVREGRVHYAVDPFHGQKTGLFLDQRENRLAAAGYAHGRALDAFSYNGGFAMALAPAGTEVIAVDISDDAVARIEANVAHNGLSNVRAHAMNVFDELRELERRGERFNTIVLDPRRSRRTRPQLPRRCRATRKSTSGRSSSSSPAATSSRAAAPTTSANRCSPTRWRARRWMPTPRSSSSKNGCRPGIIRPDDRTRDVLPEVLILRKM